jgi:hypothetical protein
MGDNSCQKQRGRNIISLREKDNGEVQRHRQPTVAAATLRDRPIIRCAWCRALLGQPLALNSRGDPNRIASDGAPANAFV